MIPSFWLFKWQLEAVKIEIYFKNIAKIPMQD